MESWKGNRTPSNPQEGYYVGLMNACGYRTKDLEKPVIGIVNSFTDVNPGHRAFKELVGYVKAFMSEWLPIKAALNHRPFNPESAEHRAFIEKTQQRVATLKAHYPELEI